MTSLEQVLMIVGMALVTFSIRYPLLALVGRLNLPPGVFQTLRFVPVAVLTATVAPIMLLPDDQLNLRLSNAYLVAGVITIGIAAWQKKLLPTIMLGMAVFFAWRWIASS
jgi:branched-subunit amino acid transport protein